jgi:Kef-type K+ transport system membrane component KefB
MEGTVLLPDVTRPTVATYDSRVNEDTLRTLMLVVTIAAMSPFISDLAQRWTRLPGVVVEIVLGIIIGPHVLGWATLDEVVAVLAEMGLVFLIFLAGFEIDVARVRGRPVKLAVTGWLISLALGTGLATALWALDVTVGIRFVAIALTTTAIGTLLPILGDARVLPTRFGAYVLAGGAMGEIGPIIAISLALTSDKPGKTTIVLAAFAAIAGVAAVMATRPTPPRLVRLITKTMHTSAQLGVRLCVLMCVGLVWVAGEFGLDVLLGAFAAGMIARVFLVTQASTNVEVEALEHGDAIDARAEVQTRLESLGFGFFIPLFFVISGVKFNLAALESVGTLLKIPMFLALFLIVRGVPALLYRKDLPAAHVRALALFQAAGLPLLVVITGLGVEKGMMRSDNAAALVGAGLVSVVVFPILGLSLYSKAHHVESSSSELPHHA